MAHQMWQEARGVSAADPRLKAGLLAAHIKAKASLIFLFFFCTSWHVTRVAGEFALGLFHVFPLLLLANARAIGYCCQNILFYILPDA